MQTIQYLHFETENVSIDTEEKRTLFRLSSRVNK